MQGDEIKRTFSYPLDMRILMILAIVVFSFCAIGPLIQLPINCQTVLISFAFIFLAIVSILAAYCLFAKVTVNESLIEYRPAFGKVRQIGWSNISRIVERSHSQRLDLYKQRNKKYFSIHYQLSDYTSLFNLLRVKRPDLWKRPHTKTFHRSSSLRIIIYGLTSTLVILAIMSFFQERYDVMLFLLGISVMGLLAFQLEPTQLTIQTDSITLKYPLRKKSS